MLNVIICDDEMKDLSKIRKILENYIFIEDIDDVEIELATTNPNEVRELFIIEEVHANGTKKITPQPLKQRLLFLDLNFGQKYSDISGAGLGMEIRQYDIRSDIVFVTSSSDDRSDVIDKKITPLGYLKKSLTEQELRAGVIDLLKESCRRMNMFTLDRKMIKIQTGLGEKHVDLYEIQYMKGSDTKGKCDGKTRADLVELYLRNESMYLRKSLKFYEETITDLVRLGRSYLVNPLNVDNTRVTTRQGILTMKNGHEIRASLESFYKYEKTVSERFETGLL